MWKLFGHELATEISDQFRQGRKLKNKAKEVEKQLESWEVAKLTRDEVKKQKKRIGFVETFLHELATEISDRFGQGRKLKHKAKELEKELETWEVTKLRRDEVKK